MPSFLKRTSNNDIADLAIRSLEFNGDFNWGYELTGLAIGLSDGIHQTGANLQVNNGENRVKLNLALLADQTWSVTPKEGPGLGELGGPLQVEGFVSGGFGITKAGPGRITLARANTYTGQTFVREGSLLINGAQPASSAIAFPGAVLATRGVTGSVTVLPGAMTIAGLVPDQLVSPARARVAGDLMLSPGATLATNANVIPLKEGNEPCGRFDVQRNVVLAGATLLARNRYTPAPPPGSSCTIIDNQGTLPVIGAFSGLPEGAVLAADGVSLRISYVGGDGNDVVLTVV